MLEDAGHLSKDKLLTEEFPAPMQVDEEGEFFNNSVTSGGAE